MKSGASKYVASYSKWRQYDAHNHKPCRVGAPANLTAFRQRNPWRPSWALSGLSTGPSTGQYGALMSFGARLMAQKKPHVKHVTKKGGFLASLFAVVPHLEYDGDSCVDQASFGGDRMLFPVGDVSYGQIGLLRPCRERDFAPRVDEEARLLRVDRAARALDEGLDESVNVAAPMGDGVASGEWRNFLYSEWNRRVHTALQSLKEYDETCGSASLCTQDERKAGVEHSVQVRSHGAFGNAESDGKNNESGLLEGSAAELLGWSAMQPCKELAGEEPFSIGSHSVEYPWQHHVASVACGAHHSLMLLDDGYVWGCGSNGWSQIGLDDDDGFGDAGGGSGSDDILSAMTPLGSPIFSSVRTRRVVAGATASAIVTANGEVYVWGSGPTGLRADVAGDGVPRRLFGSGVALDLSLGGLLGGAVVRRKRTGPVDENESSQPPWEACIATWGDDGWSAQRHASMMRHPTIEGIMSKTVYSRYGGPLLSLIANQKVPAHVGELAPDMGARDYDSIPVLHAGTASIASGHDIMGVACLGRTEVGVWGPVYKSRDCDGVCGGVHEPLVPDFRPSYDAPLDSQSGGAFGFLSGKREETKQRLQPYSGWVSSVQLQSPVIELCGGPARSLLVACADGSAHVIFRQATGSSEGEDELGAKGDVGVLELPRFEGDGALAESTGVVPGTMQLSGAFVVRVAQDGRLWRWPLPPSAVAGGVFFGLDRQGPLGLEAYCTEAARRRPEQQAWTHFSSLNLGAHEDRWRMVSPCGDTALDSEHEGERPSSRSGHYVVACGAAHAFAYRPLHP